MQEIVIFGDETVDGIETVRDRNTLDKIGHSIVVDDVRYLIKTNAHEN